MAALRRCPAKGIRVSLHGRERTVALVASRVDRRIEEEKEKKNFEKNGRLCGRYTGLKKIFELKKNLLSTMVDAFDYCNNPVVSLVRFSFDAT